MLEDLASLLLRVVLGIVFLSCVWGCARDEASRAKAVAAASLVFRHRPALVTSLSVAMAAIASVSVLLGIFPRVGALLMVIYLVPAAMIHFAMERQALALQGKILIETGAALGPAASADVTMLGLTAAFGHRTAALKNLFLIGPAAYLVLAGARPPMLIGLGPNLTWQGLLIP